ncbi:hypothetical protein KY311_05075 [Candidatus Woesearchaeota archaeon]|nr:hypothetical protein [Candidatus Woesearchaeota archaeon]
MKQAVFLVKSIVQRWRPPFGKEIMDMELSVKEGDHFDNMEKEGPIFRLLKCDGDKALVEFSDKFTLKGHLHPRNRQIWIEKEEPVSFTYLWGEDGITKSLKLKEIAEEQEAL